MGTPIRPGTFIFHPGVVNPVVVNPAVVNPGVVAHAGTQFIATNPAIAAAAATSIAAQAATRAVTSNVFIDLGDAPAKATIVRGGQEVITPTINLDRASAVLENFIPVTHAIEPRSVRQSIAGGTLVSQGTAIDVDFLAPAQVTLGIFDGVHADLRNFTVPQVSQLLVDPQVISLISKNTVDLTAADRQNLTAKLATINVTVDDTVPDHTLAAAIVGLKTAQAFG